MLSLDAFDLKILTILQKDNRTPQRDIADSVNLSSSAVNRRIAAMEAAGVIRANVAVVDPAKLGKPITIIVEVMVENERLDLLDAVKRRLVAHPQVQQVYYVTGDADFVVILTARDMEDYVALTRELFAKANVKSFKTLVAMERAKVGLGVAL